MGRFDNTVNARTQASTGSSCLPQGKVLMPAALAASTSAPSLGMIRHVSGELACQVGNLLLPAWPGSSGIDMVTAVPSLCSILTIASST